MVLLFLTTIQSAQLPSPMDSSTICSSPPQLLTWAQALSITDLHHSYILRNGLLDSSFVHLYSYLHTVASMDFREYVFVHVIFLLKALRLFPIASGLSLNSSEWLTQSSKTWALMSPAVPFSFRSPSRSLSVLEIVLPAKHDYFQRYSLCSPTFLGIFSFLLFAWLTLTGLLGLSWAITSFRKLSLTSQRWVGYSSMLPKDNTDPSTKPLSYCIVI